MCDLCMYEYTVIDVWTYSAHQNCYCTSLLVKELYTHTDTRLVWYNACGRKQGMTTLNMVK